MENPEAQPGFSASPQMWGGKLGIWARGGPCWCMEKDEHQHLLRLVCTRGVGVHYDLQMQ